MMTEKQFRERARTELRKIQSQVLSLLSDRDIYLKFEREVVEPNDRLSGSRHPLLDMVRANYVDAMSARVLAMLHGAERGTSLLHVLEQLADYPQLRLDKVSDREFMVDRANLEQLAASLLGASDDRSGRHERTLPALASVHRELDAALDGLATVLKTYYWVITDSYLDLEVKYETDPLEIFLAPWLELRANPTS